MKTQKLTPVDAYLSGSWEALGNGAPVLVALAQICSEAWTRGAGTVFSLPQPQASQPAQSGPAQSGPAQSGPAQSGPAQSGPAQSGRAESGQMGVSAESSSALSLDEFSGEALAILYAARERGIIELKAVNTAFDAAARLLAVYVEESDERTIAFRDSHKPEITVRFLDGFRELCERGLVLHHIYRDFSLTPRGFELAREVPRERVQRWLDMATEFGLHD